MSIESYADREQKKNPVLYEQTKLAYDAANDLKLALEDLGFTQRELAAAIGKSPAAVSRQLNGSENMTLATLAEFAFHLGGRFDMKFQAFPRRHRTRGGLRLVWSSAPPAGLFQLAQSPKAHASAVTAA